MRAGKVEQVADPQTIYQHPATAFVASFVGITNLLVGDVVAQDGEMIEVRLGRSTVRARRDGGTTAERPVLSLRPEALRVLRPDEDTPAGWSTLNGTLETVEYLGALTRFTLRLPDGPALRLMALSAPPVADALTVAYDPARVVVLRDAP
jgi:ABC-type Fe3+/spermidine/putrescine transport system ATPase subunit